MDRKPARVISDMRVTIPDEFQDEFDLEEGDRVWVKVVPIDRDESVSWVLDG